MNPFSNPGYLMPPLVSSFVSLILIVVVWRGTSRRLSSWLFLLFLLGMGLTSGLVFGMRSSPDIYRALPWDRVAILTGFAMFLFYYHFTLAYTNNKKQKRILFSFYLLLVVAATLAPTSLVVERMRLAHYGYAPVLGLVGYPVMISLLPLMGAAAYNLVRRYRASFSYEERNRLLYLTIGILFPLLGGLLDTFTNLPPAGIWGNLICGIICSIAIVRYHLLDIRVVVRKSLIYVLVSCIIGIPYVGLIYFLQHIFRTKLELWWMHALIILLLAIVLRPLYSRAQQLTDRVFYRGGYNYLRALQQFTRQTQSIVDPKELGSTLVELVSGAFRSSSVCLLLPTRDSGDLAVASYVGLDTRPSAVVMRSNSRLVRWFKLYGRVLSPRELQLVPELQSRGRLEKKKLEKMGAELYVPIRTRDGELSGVLILGQKLSQQAYSTEDRQVLSTLAGQMAMSLENARLYSTAIEAREDFEAWLNSMSDCVMIVNTDYTVQFVNKATTEKLGITDGQICWESLGKDARCSDCPMEHYLRGSREGLQYYENVRDREYDIATAPLVNPDGTLAVVEVLRDVTERRDAEEREKQLQQELNFSSRLASIGELAAGVAHELNNPLTGILAFSERLLRKNTEEKTREELEIINSEALRAAKVVENLRTFARHHKSEKQYSSVNDILRRAFELRAYELAISNIEAVTELASDLPLVMVDFHQIQQVFINIIMNAEQAMTEAKGNGKLVLRTEKIKDSIKISFTDDGPGIPAEQIEKIFDPFFTTRGDRGGTGLGLSVCHGMVTEHGGKIYVRSEVGKGASFFVELPQKIGNIDETIVVGE